MRKRVSGITAAVLALMLFIGTAQADYEGSLEFLGALMPDAEPFYGSKLDSGVPWAAYSPDEPLIITAGTTKDGTAGSLLYNIYDEEQRVYMAAALCLMWEILTENWGWQGFKILDLTHEKTTGRIEINSVMTRDAYLEHLIETYPQYDVEGFIQELQTDQGVDMTNPE